MSTGPVSQQNPDRPLQVVTACRARDLPVLEIAVRQLFRTVKLRSIHVLAPTMDCERMKRKLGNQVIVVSEDEFIPGVTLEQFRRLNAPHFPRAAGWYFQQLLKLQFAFVDPEDEYYLIWDADTVPLRPMRFFDSNGRMLLTKATEFHPPYFETYRRLFGEEPNREFSFIAQHMLVQKSIAREMLKKIEQRIEGPDHWAWKIMRALPEAGHNLFSEYETYGHFVKNHHPEHVEFVARTWLREGTQRTGGALPSEKCLAELADEFEFVAFERAAPFWRRWGRGIRRWLEN